MSSVAFPNQLEPLPSRTQGAAPPGLGRDELPLKVTPGMDWTQQCCSPPDSRRSIHRFGRHVPEHSGHGCP